MSLVSELSLGHWCGVTDWGTWTEARPLGPDSPLYDPEHGRTHYRAFIHEDDPEGAVRACNCGRTWVAFRRAGWAVTLWCPEGRFERWRRERRERRRR